MSSYTGGILRDVGVGCLVAYTIGRAYARATGGPKPSASIIAAGVGAIAAGAVMHHLSPAGIARLRYLHACRTGRIRDVNGPGMTMPSGVVIDAEVVQ